MYLSNKLFSYKVSSLVRFDNFLSKAWLFAIIYLNFQKIHHKMKFLKPLKCGLPVKTHSKILVSVPQNVAISSKTEVFGKFCLFFLKSMIRGHYLSKFSKRFM